MSAGAIKAGRAFVELFLNDGLLIKGLARAQALVAAFGKKISSMGAAFGSWGSAISGFGTKLAAIGTAALGGLFAASKVFADMSGSLTDMAARTGLGVEAIQELGYAAKMVGVSIEDLELGIKRMQRKLFEGADGSKSANEALALLGLTIEQLAGMNPEQQFTAIGDALSKIGDPAMRAGIAIEIFGKSGTKMLGMFARGAAGMEEFRKKARELGIVLSAEDVAAGDKFGDTLDTLWQSIKVGIARLGAGLAPALTELSIKVMSYIKIASDWISKNSGLVVSIAQLAVGITAGGFALLALGKGLAVGGGGLSAIGAIVSAAATGFGVILSLAGALLSPIGLVVGAIIAGAGAFLYFSGIGGQVINWLMGAFNTLKKDAIESFGAIGKALAAGDLAAAAKVVWALIKMEWVRGVGFIMEKWAEAKEGFLNLWADASMGMARMMIKSWALAQSAWISTTAAMSEAWTIFTSWVGDTWDSLAGWVQKRWIDIKGLVDESIDTASEKAKIDVKTGESKQKREEATGKALAETETQARAQEETVGKAEREMLGGIDEEQARQRKKRATAREAEIASAKADAEAAKKEWVAAVDAAGKASSKGPAGLAAFTPEGIAPGGGLDLTGAAKQATTVAGTFSGYGARGLGAGGPMAEIALSTKESARILGLIERKNLVWGGAGD